jgi:signal transduction histidine kinase
MNAPFRRTREWFNKSLKNRIIISTVALCLTFFVVQTFVALGFGRSAITFLEISQNSQAARFLREKIDTFFNGNMSLITKELIPVKMNEKLLNSNMGRDMVVENFEFISARLGNLFTQYPDVFRNIVYMDPNYSPSASVSREPDGRLAVRQFFYSQFEPWVHKSMVRNTIGIGKVAADAYGKKHVLLVFPLISDALERKGYVVADMYIDPLIREINSFSDAASMTGYFPSENDIGNGRGHVEILDRDGSPINLQSGGAQSSLAHDVRLTPVFRGNSGMFPLSIGRNSYTVYYAPAGKQTGWSIIVEQPATELASYIQRIEISHGLLAILVLVSILIYLSSILHRSLVPIEALSAKAKEIASAGRLTREDVICCDDSKDATGEIRVLIESFNGMLSTLIDAEAKARLEESKRATQEQLVVQQSKLAAMGEMINMIAHQWRQPLSSMSTIAGNLQVYLDLDTFDKKQFHDLLEDINSQSQYLSKTINDFRDFFKLKADRHLTSLSDILESTLGIIGKSLEYKHIGITKTYGTLTKILVSPNELMQVFLNIIKNAYDALVNAKTEAPHISIRTHEESGYQVAELADNGPGIPEGIMEKIFEPYFTTKDETSGTGLGLYISKIIVNERCRGSIDVASAGQGALFTVRIPVAEKENYPNGR